MSKKNYPKAWRRFATQVNQSDRQVSVELGNKFDRLARWAARFRLAKSFKKLDLGDHYASPLTPQLYSAITRIFLTYTAFETYCRIIGLNPSQETQLEAWQNEQSQTTIIQEIRRLDPKHTFSSFLEEHLEGVALKRMMRDFIEGKDVNISFLARCTRHIFAHGVLTAHSSNLSVKRFEEVSQIISDFLINCMDRDFDSRVAK
ncbi:hypothetical protein [Pseudanabaena sp. 'Roaring Creek']|uniref:hypothetical protein n=1 Tax=Pseudanabaena sp. 'Roaring Creek' TaxID=1681830 RepID=UPI0006D84627|nr:hypothetical protein [Pseudanabaena sp. 'Roaring Creek']